MFQSKRRRLYVITPIEFIEVLFLFSFILYFLFPKTLLKHVIVSEESNYDLAFVYLENMLKLNPDNNFMTMELVKVSIKLGRFSLAEELLTSLEKKISTRKEHVKLLELFYELEKQIFYYSYDVSKKLNAKKHMRAIIRRVVLNDFLTDENYMKWYNESSGLNDKKLQFNVALYAYMQNLRSVYWIKQCYYLSAMLKYNIEPWLELLVKRDIKNRDFWRKSLISHYINQKKYIKAFKVAESGMEKSSLKKQKKYFIQAMNILMWGKKYKELVNFAKIHEDYFINSIEITNKILESYLGIGALKEAARFSKKLLKVKYDI